MSNDQFSPFPNRDANPAGIDPKGLGAPINSEGDTFPMPVQGIPGVISADVITQNFIRVLTQEINSQNSFLLANYNGNLAHWFDDNNHGIYRPAPAAIVLKVVHPDVAAKFENTGNAGLLDTMVTTVTYFVVPPGTIAAPVAAPALAQPSNPIGPLHPGTQNIYDPAPGDTLALGSTYTDPVTGIKYLKQGSPMTRGFWMQV